MFRAQGTYEGWIGLSGFIDVFRAYQGTYGCIVFLPFLPAQEMRTSIVEFRYESNCVILFERVRTTGSTSISQPL